MTYDVTERYRLFTNRPIENDVNRQGRQYLTLSLTTLLILQKLWVALFNLPCKQLRSSKLSVVIHKHGTGART